MGANGLNHETHEIHEKKNQNHEWTRNTRKEKPEPRMDTNVHEWVEPRNTRNTRKGLRTTNGHECTRMG